MTTPGRKSRGVLSLVCLVVTADGTPSQQLGKQFSTKWKDEGAQKSELTTDALEPHTNGCRRDDEKGDRYPQKRLQCLHVSPVFQSVKTTSSARQPAAIS